MGNIGEGGIARGDVSVRIAISMRGGRTETNDKWKYILQKGVKKWGKKSLKAK